ncbi:MAG: hypothetical protein Q4D57_06800 [Clostridia bacterium]|nr:hypothetical protein [Clostridia bacterium]
MRKLWTKFSLYIKRIFYIKGFKNFDFFFEKYKRKFEDAKFSYTVEDIQKCAKDEYGKFRNKIYISGFIISLIFVLLGSIGMSTDVVAKIATILTSFICLFSEDAWLGFFGNVMGSIVAIIGVYITIRFERKKTEKEDKEKIKPIILFTGRQNEEENLNNTYQIRLSEYGAYTEDKQRVEYSEYVIRNVGYAAINLKIGAVINGVVYAPDKIINYIPANDYIIIKMSLEISKKQYKSLFQSKEPQNSFIIMYNDIKGILYTDTYKGFASYEKAGEDYNLKMKITT